MSANDGTLDNSVAKATAALDAEIHWCMKVVESHSSYRLCLNLKLLFQKMFPDSDIASKFAMSKTKCGYFITHGIAPFYKSGLLKEINLSPFYSVLFGESLNNLIQKEQIDVQIRFWNDEKACSETRYLVSKFFLRPNADALQSQILDAITPLDVRRMNMLGMDGANTNWSVLEKMTVCREKDELPALVTIGSCGLHVVHGVFETGFKATDYWNLHGILKAMHRLLHNSPARRDVYLKESMSTIFPKQ